MTSLQRRLLQWYSRHGRATLPWRTVRDPYRTLVSEFMLQQTQVDRVVPKFEAFIACFPDVATLARATTADVLREWKGLGYNSRALRLQQVARAVVERHGGQMPRDAQELRALPGIGPYTAAAIRAFAFDLDDAPIDTNVRRVVHRIAFGLEHPPRATAVEIDERARAFVPGATAHDWNSALMDLGATICTARAPKCLLCPLQTECVAAPIDAAALERARARHAKLPSPQSAIPFEKTTRYARGRLIDRLRDLPAGQRVSLLELPVEQRAVVGALERDGLVTCDGDNVALSE